jgi:hypothetical protein
VYKTGIRNRADFLQQEMKSVVACDRIYQFWLYNAIAEHDCAIAWWHDF